MAEPVEVCHWKRLTPDILDKIASKLHPNEVAVGLKLVDRSVCACLRQQYRAPLQLARELPTWLVASKLSSLNVSEFALADQPWPASSMVSAFLAHFGKPETWRGLTLRQRRRLLCCAASSGDAASLDLVLQHCGCHPPQPALIAAVLVGDVRACEKLLAAGCEWSAAPLEAAMRAGQLDVCRLLVSAGCPLPGWPDRKDALGDLAATAARGGHERVLLWMESEPGLAFGPAEPFDRRKTHYGLVSAAAEGGHVELMELLDQQQAGGNTAGPQLYNLESIAYGCTLEVLQRYWALWVEGQGWTGGPGPYGIGGDGVPPLPVGGGGTGRLLAAAGASPTPDWAAKLDFIRSKRPGDSFDWIHNWNAARRATLLPDLLPRLLHLAAVGVDFEFECDLDAACVAAAGHADALTYLLDNTSQTVNERVVDKALTGCGDGDAGRQLQTLQLLAARGCVFGPGHVATAGAAGAAAGVLRWLAESVPDTAAARDGAAGAAGAVAAAGEAGTGAAEGEVVMSETDAWSAAFTAAAKGGGADLPLLRYLHEVRGAAVDLVAVAAAGSEEALDWAAAELKRAGQPLPVRAWLERAFATQASNGVEIGGRRAEGGLRRTRRAWAELGLCLFTESCKADWRWELQLRLPDHHWIDGGSWSGQLMGRAAGAGYMAA